MKPNPFKHLTLLLPLGIILILGMIQPGKGYDKIDPFKNGWAKVYQGNFMGYINTKGEEVIACRYHFISDFVNGVAKVRIDKKFGYINNKDEEVIPIKYEYIGPFQSDLAQVKINGQFGVINRNGEEITPIIYDEIGSFNKRGFARVRIKSLEGRIDTTGVEVIPVFKSAPIEEE